jgi:DNA-binding SARP family transcriptional activator
VREVVDVRYRVLGPLTVDVDGVPWSVPQRRERLILSLLVAAHGTPVSADRLVAAVWGDEAPPRALASLQVAVSRLRTLLEPDRPARAAATRLVSAAGGYALRAAPEDVDAWLFTARAEEAIAAPPPARLALADAALALWRGDPFPDTDEVDPLQAAAARLTELRDALAESRAVALLETGHLEAAERSLAELAPTHPFRERLWARLALAQYRSGRQAYALETLRTLRVRLDDELGSRPRRRCAGSSRTSSTSPRDWPPATPAPQPPLPSPGRRPRTPRMWTWSDASRPWPRSTPWSPG